MTKSLKIRLPTKTRNINPHCIATAISTNKNPASIQNSKPHLNYPVFDQSQTRKRASHFEKAINVSALLRPLSVHKSAQTSRRYQIYKTRRSCTRELNYTCKPTARRGALAHMRTTNTLIYVYTNDDDVEIPALMDSSSRALYKISIRARKQIDTKQSRRRQSARWPD